MADHVKLKISTELEMLLKQYPELRVDEKKGKVCCCLTGHEMPIRGDAVQSYVKGKKFLKAQQQREFDFDQYKPHLVPNTKRGFQHTLFCMLTLRCVTKRPADVERHVNGKRYQRALKRWKACQESGEKFKPRGGRRHQTNPVRQGDHSSSDGGDAEGFWQTDSENEAEHDDGLSDLYPSDDFASASEEDEEMVETDRQADPDHDDHSDVDTSGTAIESTVNGQSQKAMKRKKSHTPVGKKKKKT